MQFKVPQDVQREDTIVGPLTLKQMIILGVGGGIAYGIYVTLSTKYFIEVWLAPVAIISCMTLAFAFLKIHRLPFHLFLMNFIEFHLLPRKRIWVQGADNVYRSPFEKDKKEEIAPIQPIKDQKTIEALSKLVDTKVEADLSKEEKKEGLKELIDQNYK